MIDWIRKTINPPGINKPNRFALFSTIGEAAERVRVDAITAFNAHFPYLADRVKLEEHGKALIIPRLLDDTEREFRDRVSTASFFLTRAGERAYIKEQLQAHFGDRYILQDEFLNVYVRITDLENEDRAWVNGFLDWILDPNIALTVAEWFHFVEEIFLEDAEATALRRTDADRVYQGLCCDRRFLCDQGKPTLCDGTLICDGLWNCGDFQSARGTVFDTVLASVFPDGSYRCDGSFDGSGYVKRYAPLEIGGPILPVSDPEDALSCTMRLEPFEEEPRALKECDGSWACDGGNLEAITDTLTALGIITPIRCDGARTPSCAVCDGAWACGGSHACFDGWYCSGDLIEEVAV